MYNIRMSPRAERAFPPGPRSEEERPSGPRLKKARPEREEPAREEKSAKASPEKSELFDDKVRDIVKMFDDRLMRMTLDMDDRSRMNLAAWRMVKDQDFALKMLNEALFFAKERPLDKKLPLLKRLSLVSDDQLFQGLMKALELSSEEASGMDELRRMDNIDRAA